jgi:carboxymethylenebutenolidase
MRGWGKGVVLALVLVACDRSPTAPATPTATATSTAPATATPTATPTAPAPPTPTARPGTAVSLPNGASGYLSLPSGDGKHPAVITVQEWWGLNDWIKANTDRFAQRGYVTLAVDLYRGHSTTSPDEAHELMRGLPEDRALGDLQTAFAWLAQRADVDASRIGVIGWCMGGGYALALATEQPKLRAAAVNYGRLVTAADKIAKVRAALLGNFAGQDRGIPPDDVRAFERALKTTNRDVDIKIYDPDGHAFMNPGNTKGYDEAAATDAWGRIDAFFARTLR